MSLLRLFSCSRQVEAPALTSPTSIAVDRTMDIGDKLFIHLQYERQQIVAENSSPFDLGPRENVAMTLDHRHAQVSVQCQE